MVRNALLWSVMYPSQVRLLQTTAFVTMATAAPGGSLLRKNNGRQSSLCTYLTFRAQAEAMAPPGGDVCSFLICISKPWSWLFTYLWNSSVQWMAGDQNNQIKIKPMINLPGASNCIRFSLKADQSHGPTVQSAGHSLLNSLAAYRLHMNGHERQLKQQQRSLVVGSSTADNSLLNSQ